jgi:hypothetical protein
LADNVRVRGQKRWPIERIHEQSAGDDQHASTLFRAGYLSPTGQDCHGRTYANRLALSNPAAL